MVKFCYSCRAEKEFKLNYRLKKPFQHCQECRQKYKTKERNERSRKTVIDMLKNSSIGQI